MTKQTKPSVQKPPFAELKTFFYNRKASIENANVLENLEIQVIDLILYTLLGCREPQKTVHLSRDYSADQAAREIAKLQISRKIDPDARFRLGAKEVDLLLNFYRKVVNRVRDLDVAIIRDTFLRRVSSREAFAVPQYVDPQRILPSLGNVDLNSAFDDQEMKTAEQTICRLAVRLPAYIIYGQNGPELPKEYTDLQKVERSWSPYEIESSLKENIELLQGRVQSESCPIYREVVEEVIDALKASQKLVEISAKITTFATRELIQ